MKLRLIMYYNILGKSLNNVYNFLCRKKYLIYLVHTVIPFVNLFVLQIEQIDQNAFETYGYYRFYHILVKTHSYFLRQS